MENKLAGLTKCPHDARGCLSRALRYFKSDFKKKWTAANNKEDRFLKLNEKWLNASLKIGKYASATPGRPPKEFGECSERSKRRKTEELRKQVSSEELTYAASMSQRTSGNTDVAAMIKKITETPTKATKFKKIISFAKKIQVQKHTPSEALSIFVEADLTRKQYEVIHAANKNVYPSYSLLKKAKCECYPKEESISVSETTAEVNLQDILDHTASRLCMYLEDVLDTLSLEESQNLQLISKWGCDGSQQSQFKQKFRNNTDSDANIFQSSFVPLHLACTSSTNEKKVVWQNPVPSSTRFCRPIRIRFLQETTDVTNEEINFIEDQVSNLNETEFTTKTGFLTKIKHILLPTMVDGKVCNAATSTTSTMRCYVCGGTSKDFNNLDKVFTANTDSLRFGLSVLHARIRFFECFLHLAYKIPIKKWQARTEEEKKIVAISKKQIQDSFKEEMGLLVDIPKQGFGNTNDGNTSRRFFADPETAARITGVNVQLITNCKIILETISSGHKIDPEKFHVFALETAKLYVKLYEWYPMTPTMHKILSHGSTIIKSALLPIGQLSEEAAEARNKHFRQYRLKFSRKFSRVHCNRDILNRLLLSSDPFLSCTRKTPKKKSKSFTKKTLELLLPDTPTYVHPEERGERNLCDDDIDNAEEDIIETDEEEEDESDPDDFQ